MYTLTHKCKTVHCFPQSKEIKKTNLVNLVFFGQLVKLSVHCIQHRHDFHGCNLATDVSKPYHIAEQNGNMIEDLERRQHNRIVVSRGTLKEILFSTLLNKRNDFCGFLFALVYSNLLCKGRYSEKNFPSNKYLLKGKLVQDSFQKGKNLLPAEKSFFANMRLFMRGQRKNNNKKYTQRPPYKERIRSLGPTLKRNTFFPREYIPFFWTRLLQTRM